MGWIIEVPFPAEAEMCFLAITQRSNLNFAVFYAVETRASFSDVKCPKP
jgi:hypothetical protein